MYLSTHKSNRKEVAMFSKYWNEETKAMTDEERNTILSDWECEDYPMGYCVFSVMASDYSCDDSLPMIISVVQRIDDLGFFDSDIDAGRQAMEDGYKCKPLYMNINGRLVTTGYRVVD
jgi:hypothetical protein